MASIQKTVPSSKKRQSENKEPVSKDPKPEDVLMLLRQVVLSSLADENY